MFREGHDVARRATERLVRKMGFAVVIGGKPRSRLRRAGHSSCPITWTTTVSRDSVSELLQNDRPIPTTVLDAVPVSAAIYAEINFVPYGPTTIVHFIALIA